jgi:hypothetical protein
LIENQVIGMMFKEVNFYLVLEVHVHEIVMKHSFSVLFKNSYCLTVDGSLPDDIVICAVAVHPRTFRILDLFLMDVSL